MNMLTVRVISFSIPLNNFGVIDVVELLSTNGNFGHAVLETQKSFKNFPVAGWKCTTQAPDQFEVEGVVAEFLLDHVNHLLRENRKLLE